MYGGAVQTGGGTNDGPTTAYTYTVVTPQAQPLAGSVTKGFFVPQEFLNFTAAGNGTVTYSRKSARRGFQYNAVTGVMSGG
jgi:hypothetical protein